MYFYFSKLLKPFLLPFNFIIFFIILCLIFRKLRRYIYFPIFFLILISVFPIGNFLNYHFLSKEFYGQNKKNFDSILILGGDERRIIHGLALWSSNKDAKIIFAGGTSYLFPNEKLKKNSETNKFYELVGQLIEKDKIIILDNTRNTLENIIAYKKNNKINNFKQTIVVSNTWHYRRVLKIADSQNLNLITYKWPRGQNLTFIQNFQNLDFANNINNFNLFVKELLGLIALVIFAI